MQARRHGEGAGGGGELPPPAQRLFQGWRRISCMARQYSEAFWPSKSKHPGAAPACMYSLSELIVHKVIISFEFMIFLLHDMFVCLFLFVYIKRNNILGYLHVFITVNFPHLSFHLIRSSKSE